VFDRWRGQAASVQRRYERLLPAYRAQAPLAELDIKPPRPPLTQVRAGYVAIAGELLSRADAEGGRTSRLTVLRDQLIELEVKGFLFAPNWPVSVTRVRAEVEVGLGELTAAAVTYSRAIDGLRAVGAAPELCRALVGLAQLHVRTGAALEDVRVLAAEAHAIAKRCGMPTFEERAGALLRRSLGGVAATPAQGAWRVVMLTDVVGSTQVSVELGDATYVRLISHHHELVRRCLVEHHGVEFGDTGDGLWSWFTSADDALACADAVRDILLLEPATHPILDVKVVLAGGEPLFHDDKPTGVLLNLAARIMGLARGGDVLANEGVARRVSDPNAFVSFGTFELRSIPGQTPIFRRVWHVQDSADPPAAVESVTS
jgi:class 3 adenylate cyclase